MTTYILLKYLSCSATPEEEAQVREWLSDDPDGSHAKQYTDVHFLYEGILLHVDGHKKVSTTKKRFRANTAWRAVAGFAAAVVMFIGGGLISRELLMEDISSKMISVYVPAGKSMQLTLEDGSSLWLNSGTHIEYPAVFSDKSREVKMHKGEVLFEIAKDESRPFYVDTYASTIEVTGTKFNVHLDESLGEFSTALLEGSVVVKGKQHGEQYTLRPNQMLRLAKDKRLYVESIANPQDVDCWTEGLIDISSLPFDKLMRRFELAYDVQVISLREDNPQINYTSGKLRVSDGIRHALEMLSLACDFDYEYDPISNIVTIK